METQQEDWASYVPDLPIPISLVGGHYLLFDVKAVSYLRREHNVCGYNIGTLPQSPSQNIFLGLPTLIMPEEAQLLIDSGIAFLLDDAQAHDQAVFENKRSRKAEYIAKARRQADEVERVRTEEKEHAARRALEKKSNGTKPKEKLNESKTPTNNLLDFDDLDQVTTSTTPNSTEPSQTTPIKVLSPPTLSSTYHVTPTTSRLLTEPTNPQTLIRQTPIPNLPSSYPLFRHLHSRGYFMTPGLRFGCQYSTYPGDPLRFHSHFLAIGVGWEEEIDLMDIVAGGRLGTGVKKGFLIGGEEPASKNGVNAQDGKEVEPKIRTFSVEWAVM
jgi:tRNA-splicing endonuclease subunit Sen34